MKIQRIQWVNCRPRGAKGGTNRGRLRMALSKVGRKVGRAFLVGFLDLSTTTRIDGSYTHIVTRSPGQSLRLCLLMTILHIVAFAFANSATQAQINEVAGQSFLLSIPVTSHAALRASAGDRPLPRAEGRMSAQRDERTVHKIYNRRY
jgi:hypothetical protein